MKTDIAAIFDELRAYKRSRALSFAISVGLLDVLREGLQSSADLCTSCGLAECWTRNLLGVLADVGLVAQKDDRWSLTEVGAAAARNEALRSFAIYHLHCYEGWLDLPTLCRSASTGGAFHRRAMAHREFATAYLLAMESIAQASLSFLTASCFISGEILDVGAGPATFSRRLPAQRTCRVTAVDLPPMVEAARQIIEPAAGFEWVGADIREYRADHRFDSVFCSHVLEYVPAADLLDWLGRLRQCAKRGGVTAIVTFVQDPLAERDSALSIFELSTGVNGCELGRVYTVEEFRSALHQAGGRAITCRRIPSGPSYPECLFTCTWT